LTFYDVKLLIYKNMQNKNMENENIEIKKSFTKGLFEFLKEYSVIGWLGHRRYHRANFQRFG